MKKSAYKNRKIFLEVLGNLGRQSIKQIAVINTPKLPIKPLFAVGVGDGSRELKAPHNSQSTRSLAEVNCCAPDEKEGLGLLVLLFLGVLLFVGLERLQLRLRLRLEDIDVGGKVGHLDVVLRLVDAGEHQPTIVVDQRHNDGTENDDDRKGSPQRHEEAEVDSAEPPRCRLHSNGVVVVGDEEVENCLPQLVDLNPDGVLALSHLVVVQPLVHVVEVIFNVLDPRLQVEKPPTTSD